MRCMECCQRPWTPTWRRSEPRGFHVAPAVAPGTAARMACGTGAATVRSPVRRSEVLRVMQWEQLSDPDSILRTVARTGQSSGSVESATPVSRIIGARPRAAIL